MEARAPCVSKTLSIYHALALATFAATAMRPAAISARALAARLQAPNLLIGQVTAPEVYRRAHIPGAVHVAPAALMRGEPPAVGKLPRPDALERLLRDIGLAPERQVVVCDDEGGGWAGRFAWTLDMAGHADWLYLDGGLHAWAAAGLAFSDVPATPQPSDFRLSMQHRPLVQAEEVLRLLDDPNVVIWDCRSAEEYAGIKVTARRNGHIPGAVHLDWLALMDRGRHLQLVEDLRERLAAANITAARQVIVHCQTHHRSGLAYMAGRLLGLPDIRAYAGSWSEWGNLPDTPVER